jgi:hypothetical protein
MDDKLSDRLWDILNEATLRNALSATQLCTIDAARALAKRVEDAPVGDLSASLARVEVRDVDIRILAWHGKRVRLVLEGE